MVDDFEEVKEILSIYENETFSRLLVSEVNNGFRLKSELESNNVICLLFLKIFEWFTQYKNKYMNKLENFILRFLFL